MCQQKRGNFKFILCPKKRYRSEYSLTETGKTLKPVLDALWEWGEGYKETLRVGEL